MTDQRHDRREEARRERERQFEIDRITFEYASAFRSGRAPRIEDYVRRYPQFTGELLEFAIYFHTVALDSEPLEEPDELTLSPAAEKALARIHEQLATYAPSPSPSAQAASQATPAIEGLVQRGIQLQLTPPQLAEAVGLTTALIARLEARAIAAASIPRALIERLAATLQTAPEAIAAYLRGGQAAGFYLAEQPPAQQQESFLDAVRSSTLAPERKSEWAAIVGAETMETDH
jgi:hypothetical protein